MFREWSASHTHVAPLVSRIVALIIHQLLKELKDLQHKLSEKYIKITQKLETTDRNNHSNDWYSASLKL